MDEGKGDVKDLEAAASGSGSGSSPYSEGSDRKDLEILPKEVEIKSEAEELEVILSQLVQKTDKEIKLRKELKCEAILQLGGFQELLKMTKKIEEGINAIGN